IRARLLLETIQPNEAALTQTAADVIALLTAAYETGNEQDKSSAATLLARLYGTMPDISEAYGPTKAGELVTLLEKWANDPKWDARLIAADLQVSLKP